MGVSGWRLCRGAIASSPERQGKRPVGVAGPFDMPLAWMGGRTSVIGALIAFQDGIGPQTNCMFGARGRTEDHAWEPHSFAPSCLVRVERRAHRRRDFVAAG